MSRQVIPPSHPSSLSPTTQALALLQKRLHTAEAETANMVRQLTDLGFPLDAKPEPKTDRAQPADPIAPFLPATADTEVLHKHYEALVSRLCRTESQLQTLKLNLCALHAEKDLGKEAASSAERDERLQEYDEEVQTLKVEVARVRKNYKESLEIQNKAENEARNLRSALEATNTAKSELEMACKKLMLNQEEIGQKNSELRDKLARENAIRASLEESHIALLDMIREMEGVVENERHEVKILSTDCLELRHEGVKVQEEKKQCQALQTRFQEMIRRLQDDIDAKDIKLAEATEEHKVLVSLLNSLKRENETLLREIQDSKIALEEAQEQIKQSEEGRSVLYDALTQVQSSSEILPRSQELPKSLEPGELALRVRECLHSAVVERCRLQSRLSVEEQRREAAEHTSSELQRSAKIIQKRNEDLRQEKSHAELLESTIKRLKDEIMALKDKSQNSVDRKENLLNKTTKELHTAKMTIQQLENKLRQAASYQRHLANAKNDESKMAARVEGLVRTNGELQAEVENLKMELECKERELIALRSDRQRSQKSMTTLQEEVERLRENLEMLENSQLVNHHSSLDKAFNESNAIAVSNMLDANSKLQTTVKQLESEVKKQNQKYRILQQTREAERATLQNQLKVSEVRLESLQQQSSTKKNTSTQNTTKELRQIQRLNDDLSSRLKESVKTNTELRARLAGLEETCSKLKDRIGSQKMQIEAGAKLRKTNQEMAHKIKDISHQLSEMERAKKEYALRNSEQAKTIASFVKQVAGLQADLQAVASSQESLSTSARKKNQEMAKEQNKLQRRASELQDALVRLQQEKTDADFKLLEASNESVQITANLEEAQSLFRTQYRALQQELQDARQRQAELEKTNADQQQMLVQERMRATEQARKASDMVRASRQALSHVARQAEVDHKTTRSQMEKMMQRLQVEKDHSTFTDNKLQKFMDISGQYIEELAMDLDRHRQQLVTSSS